MSEMTDRNRCDLGTLKAMSVRQLDEVVAEVVMGWNVEESEEECSQYTPGATWNYGVDGYVVTCLRYLDSEGTAIDDNEDFLPCRLASTWEGMGKVIERMAGLGYSLMLSPCAVEFWITDDYKAWGLTRGKPEDLPREVALAAVIAATKGPQGTKP